MLFLLHFALVYSWENVCNISLVIFLFKCMNFLFTEIWMLDGQCCKENHSKSKVLINYVVYIDKVECCWRHWISLKFWCAVKFQLHLYALGLNFVKQFIQLTSVRAYMYDWQGILHLKRLSLFMQGPCYPKNYWCTYMYMHVGHYPTNSLNITARNKVICAVIKWTLAQSAPFLQLFHLPLC